MFERGQRIRQILDLPIGSAITACGWVRTRRDSSTVSFIEMNDGSCFANLQCVVDRAVADVDVLTQAVTGAAVRVQGCLVESPGSGQRIELRVDTLEVIGPADPATYPLAKKRHSLEYLREIAHLRTRSNTFGAVFRVRNALSDAVHRFFQDRGFLWIHTPIITASDCEGAGAMFSVSTLDNANPPRRDDGTVDYSADFFGRPAYLTVSGQLEAEICAMAFTDVYTFGPTFRAENSNTPRHLAEFWMIEPEMAFCDLDGDMDLAEAFVKHCCQAVLNQCGEDLAFFTKWVDDSVVTTLEHVASTPFERLTYTEAIRLLQQSGQAFEYTPEWGADIQTEHERYLSETLLRKPVIITDYPRQIKAFYMRLNDDERTVRAMDLLVPRIGELIGGSQREERLDVLQTRIREQGMDEAPYWWYLDLRRFGGAPHAGFGLGFERLVMFATGMKNIRDVIPFPRTPGNADF